LNVPDRPQAPGSPRSGWCGECAIQQTLLFHGAYFSQQDINRAGSPRHPDLYASEIRPAYRRLGARIESGPRGADLPAFLAWIRRCIERGWPVFVGMKVHPTAHPEWMLDHFTVVSGARPAGLVINTTWNRQVELSDARLASEKKGLSFQNRFRRYFGIAVRGFEGRPEGEPKARIFVLRESKKDLTVVVKCEDLRPGGAYTLWRAAGPVHRGLPFVRFRARGGEQGFHDVLPRSCPAVFRVRSAFDSPLLGGVQPRHHASLARALAEGESLARIIRKLEDCAGAQGEGRTEARALLGQLRSWIRLEPGRLRRLARARPAAALFQARRTLRRLTGLSERSAVARVAEELEEEDDVCDLAAIMTLADVLGEKWAARKDLARRPEQVKSLRAAVRSLIARPDLGPALVAEARDFLQSIF
jgi:hypothetical protein